MSQQGPPCCPSLPAAWAGCRPSSESATRRRRGRPVRTAPGALGCRTRLEMDSTARALWPHGRGRAHVRGPREHGRLSRPVSRAAEMGAEHSVRTRRLPSPPHSLTGEASHFKMLPGNRGTFSSRWYLDARGLLSALGREGESGAGTAGAVQGKGCMSGAVSGGLHTEGCSSGLGWGSRRERPPPLGLHQVTEVTGPAQSPHSGQRPSPPRALPGPSSRSGLLEPSMLPWQ